MTIDYISPEQVQAFFPGLTPERLARWRWAKSGPGYTKVGRQIIYRTDVIEAFLAKREVAE